MSVNALYTVTLFTGEVVEGWNRADGAWHRTTAAAPTEAGDAVTRGHLAEARTALQVKERAPRVRKLHTLEQARAFLLGHVPGCSRVVVAPQQCPCCEVDPATLSALLAELHRRGRATQRQLALDLGLSPLVVRAALTKAGSHFHGGTWETPA